jgi:hypothetical protein
MLETSSFPDPLLDRCITALLEQGRSVEECLADAPGHGKALEPLLRLAVCLETAGSLQAPPDFQLAAPLRMSNLIAASPQAAAPQAHRSRGEGVRRAGWERFFPKLPARMRLSWAGAAALLAIVLALAGWGVVSAAGSSLPGEKLYPVKLRVEDVQRSLSPSPAQEARLQVAFTQERFEEAVGLAVKARPVGFTNAMQTYTRRLTETVDQLAGERSLPTADRAAVARALTDDLAGNQRRLTDLLARPPAGFSDPQAFRRDVEGALVVIQTSYDQASGWSGLLPGAGTLVPLLATHAAETWRPSPSGGLPALSTPSPRTTSRGSTPDPDLETPFFEGLLTQWPTNWPTLPATPGPNTVWTEINTPWPTRIDLPTNWPTALHQLPTLIPTLLHQYLPTGIPVIPTLKPPVIPSVPPVPPAPQAPPVPPVPQAPPVPPVPAVPPPPAGWPPGWNP